MPDASRDAAAPLLELRDISRRFSGVLANDAVSLQLQAGEVLGLLGENGAGKSTLMNILAGILSADSGQILLRGITTSIDSPTAAAAAGIGMVHQHFRLVGSMSVRENLALGDHSYGRALIDMHALEQRVAELARATGLSIDLTAKVDDLTVGQQQQLEIIRALARSPNILILDEPTAVLAPDERYALFRLVARLKQNGIGIILISHRLDDIFECCDRVVVLRRGRVAGESRVSGLSRDQLVRLIVGEAVQSPKRIRKPPVETQPVVEVESLSVLDGRARPVVNEVSFSLRAGEITCLCGVEGNGQTELLQVVAGMRQPGGGMIQYRLRGRSFQGPVSPGELRHQGVGHIAEDRLRYAVLPDRSLCDNWLMTFLHDRGLVKAGWIKRGQAQQHVDAAIQAYGIKANDSHMLIRQLSGGNQQKLVLARELSQQPALLLAAHPARGLDARTTAFVYEALLGARDNGAAVLLLTADLDEAWTLSDRIMVMYRGHLRGPVAIDDTTIEQVGHWMTSET